MFALRQNTRPGKRQKKTGKIEVQAENEDVEPHRYKNRQRQNGRQNPRPGTEENQASSEEEDE
jgi:hypothetical protein